MVSLNDPIHQSLIYTYEQENKLHIRQMESFRKFLADILLILALECVIYLSHTVGTQSTPSSK